jgi:hypothetical protein
MLIKSLQIEIIPLQIIIKTSKKQINLTFPPIKYPNKIITKPYKIKNININNKIIRLIIRIRNINVI